MAHPDLETLSGIARLFRVLSDPTRLHLLTLLKEGPRSVNDLTAAAGAKQANVSKQLGTLYTAGLVDRKREGTTVLYSVREPMIFELCDFVCGKLAPTVSSTRPARSRR